jgi:hypothetical protein
VGHRRARTLGTTGSLTATQASHRVDSSRNRKKLSYLGIRALVLARRRHRRNVFTQPRPEPAVGGAQALQCTVYRREARTDLWNIAYNPHPRMIQGNAPRSS